MASGEEKCKFSRENFRLLVSSFANFPNKSCEESSFRFVKLPHNVSRNGNEQRVLNSLSSIVLLPPTNIFSISSSESFFFFIKSEETFIHRTEFHITSIISSKCVGCVVKKKKKKRENEKLSEK